MIRSNKKLIALSNREWYAFMINNTYKLREDFTEVATLPNLRQMQYLEKKREPFKLPLEDFYRYQPYEPDVQVYEKNAYQGYDTSMTTDALRSTCEQLFEYELEGRDDVEWFYKNGDTGQQYLSIVYGTNISKEYLFYPDYIIQKENGDVWIIETKGGEVQGKSKNIDRNIENKFIAFKEYAEKENIHWGFVRDRNHKLFINNTEYSEDMSSPEWVRLEDKF
jgi:type III restriction enzyme